MKNYKKVFNDNGTYSIIINDGVTEIKKFGFDNDVNLSSIIIPDSVTSIENRAFYKCMRLESINVDIDNPNYTSIYGIMYNKDCTKLLCYPAGKTDTRFIIPYGVITIGFGAFEFCSSLTIVIIPNSVTDIRKYAFAYCTSLSNVAISGSNININRGAFIGSCDLKLYIIPKNSNVPSEAFDKNTFKFVEVKNGKL